MSEIINEISEGFRKGIIIFLSILLLYFSIIATIQSLMKLYI